MFSFTKFFGYSSRYAGRGLALASIVALLLTPVWAAGNDKLNVTRLVVVGDSLSAGFQNFSLNEPGQLNGYTSLVAKQAGLAVNGSQIGPTTFALPLISYPGIPPALYFAGGQILQNTFPGAPEPGGQPSNLSVPGFTVLDALVHPFPGSPTTNPIDALSDIVFTRSSIPACSPIPASHIPFPTVLPIGPTPYVVSQVACALALNPSAILVSIGNNDALQALTFGLPPTDPKIFAVEYAVLLRALSSTGAKIVVSNVPDVRTIPFLVPVPVFSSPFVCGFPPSGAGPDDFVVLNLLNPAGGTNLCTNYTVRSKALIDAVGAATISFNRTIAVQAQAVGAVLVDVNGVLSKLGVTGYDVVVNGQTKHLTTAMFGGLFSLDGIHPTNTGYAIIANATISAINGALSKNQQIPLVNVNAVAAVDPLAFPVFLP
jgi:lysophospholipase L1-like esterase